MIHYTLNTAHEFDCRQKRFDPEAIAAIAHLASNGSHPIAPQLPGYSTKVTLGKGSALFDVWHDKTPITINAIAWTPAGAEEVWPLLESTYLKLARKLGTVTISRFPAQPKSTPWLATCVVLPEAQSLSWLADCEQCLAIALMDRAKFDHGLLGK